MADERVTESHDWVTQLTNRLSRLVDILQDFSLKPALGIARSLLIGSVGLIIGLFVVIALLVGVTKLFNHDVFGGRVWATDFLFGGMTMAAGSLLFRSGVRRKGQRDV
jgi:hypothetical protein